MLRTHPTGLAILLATILAVPAQGQRHKEKDVEVLEWALQTLLVFPDPETGIYVWAEWKDPSIGESHVARIDPADIGTFIVSAQELMARDRPSDLGAMYEHSDPIQDIDHGHMQVARYLDSEFWARDYTLQFFSAPTARSGMEVTMTKKELEKVLEHLEKITGKTKWDDNYRGGVMHSNPALLRTMPTEDLDNAYIEYPVVLLDRAAGDSRQHAVEGDTFLSFFLDEEGVLDKGSMRVWMSDHRTFSREVTDKIKNWKFGAVVWEGTTVPVQVFYRVPFRFEVVNR